MTKNAKIISSVALLLLAVFLAMVFSGRVILPQSFNLGPLTVRYYGVLMAAAILAGFALAQSRLKQYGVDAKFAEDLLFWLIIGGFLGARIYHVFSSIGFYVNNPLEIFQFWHGGMSIYGAVLGGFLTLLLYRWLRPEAFAGAGLFKLMDWLAPSLVLGQIIGRFGNLFNYEAFGYPTNLPWKMFVPQIFRPQDFQTAAFFHPLFLYEALGNAVILWLLLKVMPKRLGNFKIGALFFCYLLFYNILRTFLELLRADSTFITPTLRLNFIASLILVVVAASFLYFFHNESQNSQIV